MGIFATSVDDPQYATNMGLFQGLARGDVAGGIMAAEDGLFRQKLSKAQLENIASEIEARKLKTVQDQRQQALVESFFPGMRGGAAAPAEPAAPTSAPGAAPASGGLLQGAPAAAPATQPSDNDIMALAKKLGIPPQAIQADLVFNGGKKISEMLAKHGAPDMQVSNGYVFDKNRQGAGYLPQLNMSQDGKASMVQIGPDGLPVVSAPRGALNTYAGYRNLDESAKANFDPVTVTPQGQNPQMTSRGALMRNPLVQGPGSQVQPGQQAPMDQGRVQILEQEMAKAQGQLKAALQSGDATAAQRAATDVASLNRELGRAGGRTGTPSLGLPLQSEAEKAAAVKQAEADVQPTQQRQNAIASAENASNVIDMALNHPGLSAATGLQGTLDPRNYIPGTNAKNFGVVMDQIKGKAFLQAFESLKGGGQITEVEGKKATDAIARLNTAQSTDEFRKSLTELKEVVDAGKARMKGGDAPAPKAPTLLPELPKTAPKGQRMRDTVTGKILKFNGMQWVEEK